MIGRGTTNPSRTIPSRRARWRLFASIALLAVAYTSPVLAQNPGGPGLVLQTMKSGLVFAPTVKVTDIDGGVGTFTGFQGGFLTDGRLFLGAGASWLTSGGTGDLDMAYGGGVVEWFATTDTPFTFSLGTLIGAGSATLTDFFDLDVRPRVDEAFSRSRFDRFRGFDRFDRFSGFDRPLPDRFSPFPFRWREAFLVAEPQANLVVHAADWLRIGLGASYRIIGEADGFEDRLRGFSGTFSVQLGPR